MPYLYYANLRRSNLQLVVTKLLADAWHALLSDAETQRARIEKPWLFDRSVNRFGDLATNVPPDFPLTKAQLTGERFNLPLSAWEYILRTAHPQVESITFDPSPSTWWERFLDAAEIYGGSFDINLKNGHKMFVRIEDGDSIPTTTLVGFGPGRDPEDINIAKEICEELLNICEAKQNDIERYLVELWGPGVFDKPSKKRIHNERG